MPSKRNFAPLALLFACASSAALAHPAQYHVEGILSGAAHPLTGLDHLLAMIAVGLWAGQLPGRAVWSIPAAFVAFMLVGGAAGLAGLPLPGAESAIAASVLALGLAVALAARPRESVGLALAALFAFFHGHAHGAEVSASVSGAAYCAGFALSTAALHLAGIGLARAAAARRAVSMIRVAGGAIAATGLMLALGAL